MMDRLAVIDSESRRLGEVLSAADPSSRCPTCPDWNALDLLWHLTEVHLFWAAVLEGPIHSETELAAVEQAKPDRPNALVDLLVLREQATGALIGQLANRADAE